MHFQSGLRNVALILFGTLVALALLEGVLRLLPFNAGLRVQPVSVSDPYFHFEPNRESSWSRGWFFELQNTIRTNNAGFVSLVDYQKDCQHPPVAVIGDSYIEAAAVAMDQTIPARLRTTVAPQPIFSFGASGAALSQYVMYATLASKEYCAKRFIITIVGNDFDESLLTPRSAPGFHYFEPDTGKIVRLDYTPGIVRKTLRSSALFMHIASNVNLYAIPGRAKREYVGNVDADASPERIVRGRNAVDFFLSQLPTMTNHPVGDFLLIIDAPRPEIYSSNPGGTSSYFEQMRQYLISEGGRRGFGVVDLTPVFQDDFKQHNTRFEFENDNHWNAVGHATVTQAIIKSRFLESLVPSDPAPSRIATK